MEEFEGELFKQEPYNKSEIICKVKDLLAKVEISTKIEKYGLICEIYNYLAANKAFVLDHKKFHETFLKNAYSLVQTILKEFNGASREEKELMCKTAIVIIDSNLIINSNDK